MPTPLAAIKINSPAPARMARFVTIPLSSAAHGVESTLSLRLVKGTRSAVVGEVVTQAATPAAARPIPHAAPPICMAHLLGMGHNAVARAKCVTLKAPMCCAAMKMKSRVSQPTHRTAVERTRRVPTNGMCAAIHREAEKATQQHSPGRIAQERSAKRKRPELDCTRTGNRKKRVYD